MKGLEEAKAISSVLEKTELPQAVKSGIVMETALGIDSDTVVKGAVSMLDSMETIKAEAENKKREIPIGYTEIEREIADMLMENTGCSILDSGEAYGRHWEKNRQIKDFRKMPVMNVRIWKDGEVDLSINIFHFLTSMLEIDDTSKVLYDEFKKFAGEEDERDKYWMDIITDFGMMEYNKRDITLVNGGNTYNWDTLLSQGIQYDFLCCGDDNPFYAEDVYIIMQIHNGCDIRGGYTEPKIFRVADINYWHSAMVNVDAMCECGGVYSDDCGYHWYPNNGEFTMSKDDCDLPEEWKVAPKSEDAEDWEYELKCSRCGKVVEFYPLLDI
jgi:hypothetical protein